MARFSPTRRTTTPAGTSPSKVPIPSAARTTPTKLYDTSKERANKGRTGNSRPRQTDRIRAGAYTDKNKFTTTSCFRFDTLSILLPNGL